MHLFSLKFRLLLLVIGVMVSCTIRAGEFEDGMKAFTHLDYATARQKFEPLATQGNADAMFFLGATYDPAYHILPSGKFYQTEFFDVALAVEWYEKAAAHENARALHHLGQMYLALQDPQWLAQFPNPKFEATAYALTLYRRAEETFRKNIEQGDGIAAFMMAVERRDEPNFYFWLEQSRQLLEIQAMNGDPVRQYYLGRTYMFRKPKITSSSGFVSDPVQAFAWFTVAARNGILHANVYQIEAAEAMRIRDHARAEKATRELLNKLNAPHD